MRGGSSGRQRHMPGQIIGALREAEMELAKGHPVVQMAREMEIIHRSSLGSYRQPNQGTTRLLDAMLSYTCPRFSAALGRGLLVCGERSSASTVSYGHVFPN